MKKALPLSYIEISKGNLIYNIKQFRRLVNPKTKIACVVKANAYGHGDREVVKILNKYVDYFQVNSTEELARIRPYTKKEILVFGYIRKWDFLNSMKLGCTMAVFDLKHALLINQSAREMGKIQKVHIAVDSHLGREGFMPSDLPKIIPELKKLKNIKIEGVYSHFANIEDTTDFSHAKKQIDTYRKALELFRKNGWPKIKTHISATSGVLAWENYKRPTSVSSQTLDVCNSVVRIGIGTYGMWPSVELEKKFKNKIKLKPALKWVTHISQVKTLPKGHSIGYGLSYVTKKPTTIAVIPQGYADGLTRSLSNNADVLIGGKRAPILGRVAMNMFVVDVSHIKNVQSEDEVVILGKQGKQEITAEEIAGKMGTINYEVTTHISSLLTRILHF